MKKKNIIGIDLAFRNTGMAHMSLSDCGEIEYVDGSVFKTKPMDYESGLKYVPEIKLIQKAINDFVADHTEGGGLVFVEVPYAGRTNVECVMVGACKAIFSNISAPNVLVKHVTPTQVKKASGFRTKEDITNKAKELYPNATWTTKSTNEHLADAIFAAIAGTINYKELIENERRTESGSTQRSNGRKRKIQRRSRKTKRPTKRLDP